MRPSPEAEFDTKLRSHILNAIYNAEEKPEQISHFLIGISDPYMDTWNESLRVLFDCELYEQDMEVSQARFARIAREPYVSMMQDKAVFRDAYNPWIFCKCSPEERLLHDLLMEYLT